MSIHRSVIANHNVWPKQLILTSTDSHFISFVMRLSSLKNSIIGNPNFVALFLNFSKSAGPLTLSTKDGIRSRANDFTVGDISLIVIRYQVLAIFFIHANINHETLTIIGLSFHIVINHILLLISLCFSFRS